MSDDAAEAIGHLQQAALELVRAGRAALDATEAALRDPRTAAAIAAAASQLVGPLLEGWTAPRRSDAAGQDVPVPDRPRVARITVVEEDPA